MKVLKNVCFYDFKNFERQAYIVFDEHILKIGKMKDFDENAYKSTIIIDAENHLVMPSLVVGHTHLYATLSRGLSVPFNPNDFKELLQQLWWRIDAQLEEKSIYASGLVGAIDYVKNGVTTLIDHHASGLMIEGSLEILKKAVVEDVGLRGAFCFETSDRFDIDACIRENESFILNHAGNAGVYDEQSQENHANYQSNQSNPSDQINPSNPSNPNHPSNLAKGLFGAHAMLTLSEATLRKIKAAIGDTPLHIHVAESLQDEKECVRLYGERVVERLDRFGLLSPNSLLSHCIHINEAERKIIKKRGCVVAVNVSSNMNNAVGLPDLLKMKAAGIPLIIGNDGIGPNIMNEWSTLLFCMHHRYGSPTEFNFKHLLEMIETTYAYANAILGTKLGKIEVGYDSDLLMVPYDPPTPLDANSALGHLIFGLSGSFKPKHVFCAGKWVVNEYEVSESLIKSYASAKEQSKLLWKRIQENEVIG